jgi:hypothetical protein
MNILTITSAIIQIVKTTVNNRANIGIPAELIIPTIKLKTMISNAKNERNQTNLAKLFQRKIKKFIFIYISYTTKIINKFIYPKKKI